MATCYRHPNRETGVSCSNCDRPICPDCMTPTSVGMRCPECARQKTKVHTIRTMASEPRVTYALIVINVLFFLADGGGSGGLQHDLALLGRGFDGTRIIGVGEGQYWRLITGGFLHANILHIGFNMYLLYMLGRMLEPAMGSLRFGALYFAALLAGSCGALVTTPHSLTVGASGAVFGLMGATFLEFRSRGIDPFAGGIMGSIGGLIVINLVFSFAVSGVSIGGHIGGLIGGGVAAWLMQQADRRRLPSYVPVLACVLVAAVSVAGAIAAAGGNGL
jgi:membrane associated rhomboid family serine protease